MEPLRYTGKLKGAFGMSMFRASIAFLAVTIYISALCINSAIAQNIPAGLSVLGQQAFSTAQLATAQSLAPPAGTVFVSFFPECGTAGKDGVCIRFNPKGTADPSASPPLGASLQLYLGENNGISTAFQVILDGTAVGPTGTTPALTAIFYGR